MKKLKLLLSAFFICCIFFSYAGIVNFPEKLTQWTLSEGPYIISVENLYDYAGNDYDTFFEYGFRKGNKVTYINESNQSIEVSVFEFLTPTHALGLFSFFKEDIYIDKNIPCESIFISHYGSFQKGKYVVNIIGDSQSDEFESSIHMFAKELNKLIPEDCIKPVWFDFTAYDSNPENLDNYRLFFGNIVLDNYYSGLNDFIPEFHEAVYFPIKDYNAFIFKCKDADVAKYYFSKISKTSYIKENSTYKKFFSTITVENLDKQYYKIKRKGDCIILLNFNSLDLKTSPVKAFRKAVSYKK